MTAEILETRYATPWVRRLAYAHADARYLRRAQTRQQRRAASIRYTRIRLADMLRKIGNRRMP